MATQGVFDVFGDPLVGLPILFVAFVGIFGGYLFPKKIPPLVVAIVGGIIYAFCLGRNFRGPLRGSAFYIPDPVNSVQHLINGFAVVSALPDDRDPVEIYNFIETMDNVEGANAAGDNYDVRETQFADGICTMLSAVCGGRHPEHRVARPCGAEEVPRRHRLLPCVRTRAGRSRHLRLFTFLSNMVPPAVLCGYLPLVRGSLWWPRHSRTAR